MSVDVKRLRELALRATPGEWCSALSGPRTQVRFVIDGDACPIGEFGKGSAADANAAYVAAASPSTVIGLLDEIERLHEEVLRLGTRSNLFEVREKQATEMCTWLTTENQRLRDALKLAEHLDGELDDVLDQNEEDVVENAQLQNALAEACDIAESVIVDNQELTLLPSAHSDRIAVLRRVGSGK